MHKYNNKRKNIYIYTPHDQRKLRSQTSDNMDGWKSRGGRVREEKRRERVRRKKMQPCEKVAKSRFTVFFQ